MMNKYTAIGIAALLCAVPTLAACGETNTSMEDNEPGIVAPLPELSTPDLPDLSDSVPPFSEQTPPAEQEPNDQEPTEQEPEEQSPAHASEGARYIRVCVNGLNVRSGAGVSFPVLGQAEKDVLLKYEGTEGGWHRTQYRGKTAYVSASELYTSLSALPVGDEKIEAVIAEGLKLLGTPYVYGATRYHDGAGYLLKGFSTEKFDCSSLMQYIFYRGAGVLLDVTTRTQVKQGTPVDRADLQRGDLMFFTNAARFDRSGVERVGHVALYLGENYILHTASDYAKIEQISATRWNYFLTSRRIL